MRLADAEKWLREAADLKSPSLRRAFAPTIAAELDRLRSRIAALESSQAEAEQRGRRQAFEEAAECFRREFTTDGGLYVTSDAREFADWLAEQRDACGRDGDDNG